MSLRLTHVQACLQIVDMSDNFLENSQGNNYYIFTVLSTIHLISSFWSVLIVQVIVLSHNFSTVSTRNSVKSEFLSVGKPGLTGSTLTAKTFEHNLKVLVKM